MLNTPQYPSGRWGFTCTLVPRIKSSIEHFFVNRIYFFVYCNHFWYIATLLGRCIRSSLLRGAFYLLQPFLVHCNTFRLLHQSGSHWLDSRAASICSRAGVNEMVRWAAQAAGLVTWSGQSYASTSVRWAPWSATKTEPLATHVITCSFFFFFFLLEFLWTSTILK